MKQSPEKQPADRNEGLPPWNVRRKFMFAVTGFCMAVIVYILYNDMHGRVAETATMSAFGVIAALVTGYVLGATWDDLNTRRYGGHRSWRRDDDDDFNMRPGQWDREES